MIISPESFELPMPPDAAAAWQRKALSKAWRVIGEVNRYRYRTLLSGRFISSYNKPRKGPYKRLTGKRTRVSNLLVPQVREG
jgi:hypothetical protein